MTAAPRVVDTFKNLDFVFNNPYVFPDRFNGEDGYFKQAERSPRGNFVTNYVSDVLGTAIMAETAGFSEGRGPGVRSTGTRWSTAPCTITARRGPWACTNARTGMGPASMC